MKSSKIKILATAFLVFVFLVVGLFYYASTKLRPEEIKRIAIQQTQKIFPKSEVNLQGVEINWGLNFKINLQKFSIVALKDNHKIEMMSVDQLVVKVPIWAILSGSGLIDVKMDAPLMNYHELSPTGNNWTYAMADGRSPEEKKQDEEKKQKELEEKGASSALGFFGKSKVNIKLSDVSVKYSLRDNSKGELKVSRFLIKGLNFESSTAFEIASSAKFVMKDKSSVAFDTIAIGEFNIADLIKNGSVSSLIIVKLNNVTKTGLNWKIPEITTNVDLLLKKDGELSGKFTTSFEGQNKVSAQFKMSKQIEISDLNAEIFLKDIAAIMNLDKSIDMSKAKLTSKGSVLYGEDKKLNANINFAVSPGIIYAKDGVVASTSLTGEFKGKDILLKIKTDAMEGQVMTSVTGEYDLNEKFDLAKLKPFDIKISAAGMKIPEKFIRSRLWDKKVEEASTESDAESSEKKKSPNDSKREEVEAPAMGIPPSNITLDWNNINIGGEDFSGRGRVVTSLKSVAVDEMNFKFSKGTGKLTQTMSLGRYANESKFNLELSNLNLSSFKAFLPPFVENFTGLFSGKVNGMATLFKGNRAPTYDVNVVADAKNGEIKKLNISDYVNPLLANIPIIKDKMKDKPVKIDGNFETFSLKGRFTNSQYSLAAVDFVGISKKVQVTGSGDIFPVATSGKNSIMEVNFTDNTGKISEVLLKNVGTKILPLRLSGPGFDLKPDYSYTISKLAKGAMKTKGEEKIKEVLQKNIDKILPEATKEKVKGLLDGFFKKK